MTDITIIIPINAFDSSTEGLLENAVNSVIVNSGTYTYGKLLTMIVGPREVVDSAEAFLHNKGLWNDTFIKCQNATGKFDFCSQVNVAANEVKTMHFSILEVDDRYSDKWFKMAHEYYRVNESVSLFLPITVIWQPNAPGQYGYSNEIAWAGSFSNEIGYIDFDCLQDYSSFNLTGGIFNTEDYRKVGGFKPSIQYVFSYELLLRMTKKELKVYVVPKEGYVHVIGREGSISDTCVKTVSEDGMNKWLKVAKSEYMFTEDRNVSISGIKDEKLT